MSHPTRTLDLGIPYAVGILSTANKILSGAWVVTFPPEVLPRQDAEWYHGSVLGPGGYFVVYFNTNTLHSNGANGLINTYDPAQAAFVRRGTTISFHWSTTSIPAPQVWLWFRPPQAGRL